MQPVIWVIQFKDGSQVKEIDENLRETVFAGDFLTRKSEFEFIGLRDMVNNLLYSINLSTGELILNGQNFSPAKEIDGRIFPVSHLGLNYREGVIQYKASKPVTVGVSGTVSPATFNIGYKVNLPDNFMKHKVGECIASYTMVQVVLSINADTFAPSFAITFLMKKVFPDGKEEMIKI